MPSNMQLDDALTILGRCGTVTLRKGTNNQSASPGHTSNNDGWTCEISLVGYLNSGYSRKSIGSIGRNLSARDAALSLLEQLEKWLESDDGKTSRQRYVTGYEQHLARVGQRNDCFNGRTQHPGPMHPLVRIKWE